MYRCHAGLIFNKDSQTYIQYGVHNHPDDHESIHVIDFLNFCRGQARETVTPLHRIYLQAVDR